VGQICSSLGDWVGLVAIVAVVKRIYDDEFAIAAVLVARIGPALFFSPVAGVLADRWDRKKVMVFCDLARAGLIATLPFLETIASIIPLLRAVVLLLIVSAALEMLTLLWQPAKDASVPDMVENRRDYTHAYSLLLLAAYATFPLSGAVFGLLANASVAVGNALGLEELAINPEHLAFFLDAITFMVSAALTLTLRIAPRPSSSRALDVRAAWEELLDGLKFVWRHDMIRPWVLGIGGAFAGIGIYISMAPFFVSDVLGGGPGSFGFLVTAVGLGLGTGFIVAAPVALVIPKDIIFSTVVMAMGLSMVGFGTVSTLSSALIAASVCGVFAGFAYPSGYALIQERLGPELRGRASSAVNSVIRLAVVGAAAVAPALVKIVDQAAPGPIVILDQSIDVRGIRVSFWVGGLMVFFAGLITTSAVRARWRFGGERMGLFLVFEGGEGSGKSTQIELLRQFLVGRGRRVVVTHEPGGTVIGERLRHVLLDPASASMSAKTEALLYAADRAQHVDEVIRPALAEGSIVICDRYVDSSIAYQGLVRGLGAEEIRTLNRWGTAGLSPDLVFLLDVEAERGLERAEGSDRIEREGPEFHRRVREAYRMLAERQHDRFVIIDASKSRQQVAEEVRRRVEPYLERETELFEAKATAT
jgi:dTMP kinase